MVMNLVFQLTDRHSEAGRHHNNFGFRSNAFIVTSVVTVTSHRLHGNQDAFRKLSYPKKTKIIYVN